ncbi:hypothetical protein SO802_026752 [Lithocarpus litseifolius]|uniref:DUF4283 domain-containing protein n=1 Tax=Lithocarpus litseifolius TaxID=425828 RepID=A0AAW2C0Y7_9ROSI
MPSSRSYKDKLMGVVSGAYAQMCSFNDSFEDVTESDNEVNELAEGFAAVKLSKDIKSRIHSAWTNALIVKVFGCTVGYHFLHGRVLSIWRLSARVDWLDLGKDFFLFRFESKQDMDNMLAGGPWFIGGHYIAICVWEPYFRPSSVEEGFSGHIGVVDLLKMPLDQFSSNIDGNFLQRGGRFPPSTVT